MKHCNCSNCNKEMYVNCNVDEYIYKIKINKGKFEYYCSYKCFKEQGGKLEHERKTNVVKSL